MSVYRKRRRGMVASRRAVAAAAAAAMDGGRTGNFSTRLLQGVGPLLLLREHFDLLHLQHVQLLLHSLFETPRQRRWPCSC